MAEPAGYLKGVVGGGLHPVARLRHEDQQVVHCRVAGALQVSRLFSFRVFCDESRTGSCTVCWSGHHTARGWEQLRETDSETLCVE